MEVLIGRREESVGRVCLRHLFHDVRPQTNVATDDKQKQGKKEIDKVLKILKEFSSINVVQYNA